MMGNEGMQVSSFTGHGEEFGKIYVTRDYSIFKSIRSNRKINPINYSKLLRSMREEQLYIPICVNERYEVVDGQHRLKAAEELGLNVFYYIAEGYGTSHMKRANLTMSTWTKDDFLNAYVNDGNINYLMFNEMKEKFGLNTSDLLKIISKIQRLGNSGVALSFEEGTFTIREEEKEEVIKFLVALEDFSFFIEYKRSKFVGAFLELFYFPGYNHATMKMRLESRAEALTIQFTKDEYIKVLANKIYSYGAAKNNIYYDIDRRRLYMLD